MPKLSSAKKAPVELSDDDNDQRLNRDLKDKLRVTSKPSINDLLETTPPRRASKPKKPESNPSARQARARAPPPESSSDSDSSDSSSDSTSSRSRRSSSDSDSDSDRDTKHPFRQDTDSDSDAEAKRERPKGRTQRGPAVTKRSPAPREPAPRSRTSTATASKPDDSRSQITLKFRDEFGRPKELTRRVLVDADGNKYIKMHNEHVLLSSLRGKYKYHS